MLTWCVLVQKVCHMLGEITKFSPRQECRASSFMERPGCGVVGVERVRAAVPKSMQAHDDNRECLSRPLSSPAPTEAVEAVEAV